MSQETHYICIIKANWLMLFREKITVYFEDNVKSIKTICSQNAESFLLLNHVLHVIITVL
jgi:hypothetical protein